MLDYLLPAAATAVLLLLVVLQQQTIWELRAVIRRDRDMCWETVHKLEAAVQRATGHDVADKMRRAG